MKSPPPPDFQTVSDAALRAPDESVRASPNLWRLQVGWGAAQITSWAWLPAMMALAFERGGPLAVGLVLAFRQIPGALAAPVLSAISERRPQRAFAAISVARASAMGGAAACAFWEAPLALFFALVALEGLGEGPLRGLHKGLLPWVIRSPRELVAASAVGSILTQLGAFAGPGLGTLVLAGASYGTLFALLSGIVLSTAIPLARIRIGRPVKEGQVAGAWLRQLSSGFDALRRDESVTFLVALLATASGSLGAIQACAPSLAQQILGPGPQGTTLLIAAVGLGGLAGGLLVLARGARLSPRRQIVLGLSLCAAPWIALAFPLPAGIGLALVVLAGLGIALYGIAGNTLLIRVVHPDVRATLLGIKVLLVLTAAGVGGMLASLGVDVLGVRVTLPMTGALLGLLSLLAYSRLPGIEARASRRDRELSVVASTALFRGLPMASCELLAMQLQRADVLPGIPVVRQGDSGESFFLVESGRLSVSADGRRLRELSAGDSFGEIALVKAVPRTATVEALEPSVLWTLERRGFLEAVTGDPDTYQLAHTIADERLGAST